MNKYPKINYIGNKTALTDWIIENLPIKKGKVVDLFSGGCSVSYALKNAGYEVISNDILFSDYVISKAIIENDTVKIKDSVLNTKVSNLDIEKKYEKIKFLSEKLYFNYEVKELAKLLCIADRLQEYEKYMFLALIRRAMIRKLPYSRMNVPWEQIVKLRDEEYSYKKYGRKRAYHNLTFSEHILDNLKNYNDSVFTNKLNNKSFNQDSLNLIKNLKNDVDIVYMDPPYPKTMNKYNDFYGLFDKMFEINNKFLDFSKKENFMLNIDKLVKECSKKAKFIVLSLNNKVSPSAEELMNVLSKYGNVVIKQREHQYKLTGKENKNRTVELLLILELKK